MTTSLGPRVAAACWLLTCAHPVVAQQVGDAELGVVAHNDNTRPAGTATDGVTRVRLVAGEGIWQPEGPASPRLRVAAFGESARQLSTPAPLLRVSEGTDVIVEIDNRLASALTVRGLVTRPANGDGAVSVAAGGTMEVRFNSGAPGTYLYWATTTDKPLNQRTGFDSQLSGAFVIDPKGHAAADRIFVLGEWDDRSRRVDDTPQPGDPRVLVINGQSWPYTERLREQVGREARWRVINLSLVAHPMHLHGFHFDVRGTGNVLSYTAIAPERIRKAVTHQMAVGSTLDMAWTPDRAGNWLFHCHIVAHISPALRFWEAPAADHANHQLHDPAKGMTGLVMGIDVTGGSATATTAAPRMPRRLTLAMWKRHGYWQPEEALGFALKEGAGATRPEDVTVPGPLLVLKKNEPVEIVATNHLAESTAIHWHGIELESQYDGVPGFSGSTGSTTPAIAPGTSMVVRFTPPRAGTFIYHTHSHDDRQLASGLYGAIVVLDDGETFDDSRDHVIVLGMQGAKDTQKYSRFPVVVNGRPDTVLRLKRGVTNRLRFVNITTNFAGLAVTLSAGNEPVNWRPLAKDGAELPVALRNPVAALRQTIATGETFEFDVEPAAGGGWWLEVKRASGEWVQQVRVELR